MSNDLRNNEPTPNNQPNLPKKEDSVVRFAVFAFGIPLLLIILLTMATH